eukprot:1160189-Pelagomonas_calceolata.AAC.7
MQQGSSLGDNAQQRVMIVCKQRCPCANSEAQAHTNGDAHAQTHAARTVEEHTITAKVLHASGIFFGVFQAQDESLAT